MGNEKYFSYQQLTIKKSSALSKMITWTNDNIHYLFGELEDLAIFNTTEIKYNSNSNCLKESE